MLSVLLVFCLYFDQSQEELARFTVDETLFPIERALYVLRLNIFLNSVVIN